MKHGNTRLSERIARKTPRGPLVGKRNPDHYAGFTTNNDPRLSIPIHKLKSEQA